MQWLVSMEGNESLDLWHITEDIMRCTTVPDISTGTEGCRSKNLMIIILSLFAASSKVLHLLQRYLFFIVRFLCDTHGVISWIVLE